jgi:hypothetical protein
MAACGLATVTQCPANAVAAASFPGKRGLIRGNFWQFVWAQEPVEGESVSYRGTAPTGKIRLTIRFPANLNPERF